MEEVHGFVRKGQLEEDLRVGKQEERREVARGEMEASRGGVAPAADLTEGQEEALMVVLEVL